ncbi:LytTR family DNA-binding domain-containing protein [Sporomusa sp. KB1]|jgi:two-component system LytT family response regulator/two-component system response regulator LytT|uniref:LytR/AlgR family response regulator transcription factor n=1 Tax=Sporomusa sp. KB1 TaxID=943346 RepID=UPI00119E4E26|nr:LytTR family DNA-binding domain-containing protein [Sporomusa sp. KB1]TWH46581.1 LytTR family two component transcriptional regulator [Sporomusa sp. KB1]
MRTKTVIVDDEQPICDEIEYLLGQHQDIEICGKFTNCIDALIYILEKKPALVFLDVSMPGMSGLEMAQKLSSMNRPPYIVFITAYPEHAVAAFATPAVGYITKPVTAEKLAQTLTKVRHLSSRVATEQMSQITKVCVLSGSKILPMSKSDIVFIYVKDKDVYVRTRAKEFSAMLTLQEFDNLLTEANFLRIHRQYIINVDEILEIIPWFHGSYLLRMNDANKQEVPVSRNRVKQLKIILGLK